MVAWPSDRCRRTPSSGALTALPLLMSVGHPRPYVLNLKLLWSVSFGHRLSRCLIPSQALYIVWYGQSEIEAPYGRKMLLFYRAFSRVCLQRSVCCCIVHIVILNWEKNILCVLEQGEILEGRVSHTLAVWRRLRIDWKGLGLDKNYNS